MPRWPMQLWAQFTGHPRSRQRTLCGTFQRMAVRTCLWLDNGRSLSLVPGEPSITDVQLFELGMLHPFEITIIRYAGRVEGREGADWEWYIGGSDGWYPMRVQAKKLDRGGTGTYPDVLRVVAGSGSRQIDLLIDRAGLSAQPMYCFYNGLDAGQWPPLPDWAPSCAPPKDRKVYGCTMARAEDVRSATGGLPTALKDVPFGLIAPISFPWSDLVCCHRFGATPAEIARDVCERDGGIKVPILDELPERVLRREPPRAGDRVGQNLAGSVIIRPTQG